MALRLLPINSSPDVSLSLVQYISDFPILLNTNLCSILDLQLKILWKGNTLDFENLNKSMRATLFFLNWLSAIGHIVIISSFGHLFPSIFDENDIGLWNTLIQLWQPKLNFPFISQLFIPRRRDYPSTAISQLQTIWYSIIVEEEEMEPHWKNCKTTPQFPSFP